MTDTDITTDFERFNNERTAANAMRDELFFITGLLTFDNPEVAERIQKTLDTHKQERDQVWGF